jgi:3-oxoacyl-[acyl-carrier protein] reductase
LPVCSEPHLTYEFFSVDGTMNTRLAGRVAVITGAGRGIGRAIAIKFAEEGASVIVSDLEQGYADGVAKRIIDAGGEARAVRADVRDRTDVEDLFKAAHEFNHIDILVNNAGIRKDAFFNDMSKVEWDTVIDTLLKGCFNCSQVAAKYMMKQGYGKILNVASPVPANIALKGQVNYSTANEGLAGFTRSLSIELGPYNINVNCIAPDYIDTDMTRQVARKEGLYLDDLKKFVSAAVPIRRLGTTIDVANLAIFLTSDESDFITGQVVAIKGGP